MQLSALSLAPGISETVRVESAEQSYNHAAHRVFAHFQGFMTQSSTRVFKGFPLPPQDSERSV